MYNYNIFNENWLRNMNTDNNLGMNNVVETKLFYPTEAYNSGNLYSNLYPNQSAGQIFRLTTHVCGLERPSAVFPFRGHCPGSGRPNWTGLVVFFPHQLHIYSILFASIPVHLNPGLSRGAPNLNLASVPWTYRDIRPIYSAVLFQISRKKQ